ncbi:MAG: hypothetical protein ABIB41_10245 [Nitrospirota bacterium]
MTESERMTLDKGMTNHSCNAELFTIVTLSEAKGLVIVQGKLREAS